MYGAFPADSDEGRLRRPKLSRNRGSAGHLIPEEAVRHQSRAQSRRLATSAESPDGAKDPALQVDPRDSFDSHRESRACAGGCLPPRLRRRSFETVPLTGICRSPKPHSPSGRGGPNHGCGPCSPLSPYDLQRDRGQSRKVMGAKQRESGDTPVGLDPDMSRVPAFPGHGGEQLREDSDPPLPGHQGLGH